MKAYKEPTSKQMQDAINRCSGKATGTWDEDLKTALSVMMTPEQREFRQTIQKIKPNWHFDPLEKQCMKVICDYLHALKINENIISERNLVEFLGYNRTMIKLCFAILSFNGYVKTEHGKPHVLIKPVDDDLLAMIEDWK